MRIGSFLSVVALAAFAAGTTPAAAVVLDVSSYSMPNGDGTHVFGDFNYWDGSYTGSGIKTGPSADNAPLSGGIGALTDHKIPTTGFDGKTLGVPNSNVGGTGLYVGWKYLNPVITFNLAGTPTVYSINMFVNYQTFTDQNPLGDNSLVGAPARIKIGNTTYIPTVTKLSSTDEELTVTFKNGITATTFSVQPMAGGILPDVTNWINTYGPIGGIIDPNTGLVTTVEPWMMVSEVQFNGVSAVPELSTWAMMLIGFAAIGYAAYRRKKNTAGTAVA
jgi:hypothetical protein